MSETGAVYSTVRVCALCCRSPRFCTSIKDVIPHVKCAASGQSPGVSRHDMLKAPCHRSASTPGMRQLLHLRSRSRARRDSRSGSLLLVVNRQQRMPPNIAHCQKPLVLSSFGWWRSWFECRGWPGVLTAQQCSKHGDQGFRQESRGARIEDFFDCPAH